MGGREPLHQEPPAWSAATLDRALAAVVPMTPGLHRPAFVAAGWTFQLMRGGPRALLAFGEGRVALRGREDLDLLPWFPDIVTPLHASADAITVLDGELCVLDPAGRHHPEALHQRTLQPRRGTWLPGQRASFCVHDLLVLDGEDLRAHAWSERRSLLRRLSCGEGEAVAPLRDMEGDGRWLARQAMALQVPGVLARRLDSPYLPGAHPDWVAVQVAGPDDEEDVA